VFKSKAIALSCVLVLMVLVAAVSIINVSAANPFYKRGDWIRYRHIVKTSNETCVFIIKITIIDANYTHVLLDGRLEEFSGGKLCEDAAKDYAKSLGYLRTQPIEFVKITPEQGGFLINPDYTGTYYFKEYNATAKYYNGVLVWAHTKIAPLNTTAEIEIIDTSIDALKPLITERTATQAVKGLDMTTLIIVIGLAVAISVAIGFMVGRRWA